MLEEFTILLLKIKKLLKFHLIFAPLIFQEVPFEEDCYYDSGSSVPVSPEKVERGISKASPKDHE